MEEALEQYPKRRMEDRPSRRFRKGMYVLPSLFTTANVALGCYAIMQVIHGVVQYGIAKATNVIVLQGWHFDNAAKAIGFAVLFDGLDGRIARMTHTTSDFGRGLDSLADVIGRSDQADASGGDRQFLVLNCGSEPPGPFQHYGESAALKSRTSRQEVFCWDAHTSGCRRNRCGGAFFWWRSDCAVGIRGCMDSHRRSGGLPDGQYLAFL